MIAIERHVREISTRVDQYVIQHKEQFLGFLEELVATDTTDGNELKGQQIIERQLVTLGLSVDTFSPDSEALAKYAQFNAGHLYANRPNVVGLLDTGLPGRSILLNGHIDTVFPANPELWKYPPLKPTVVHDKLFGLGSCDMKAGLVSLIGALQTLMSIKVKLRGQVILTSVVDEEAGGGNGTLACIDRGYCADAAIVAEPTSLAIMPAHVGSTAFRLTVPGQPAHANMKSEGVSAIDEARPILNEFADLEMFWREKYQHPLLPPVALNVGKINGGVGATTVADCCELECCFSYHPSGLQDGENGQIDDIKRRINKVVATSNWLSANPPSLAILHDVEPYEMPISHGLIKTLRLASQIVSGHEAPISGFPAGSDARLLGGVAQVPTVIFGPGDIRLAHRVNEFVPVSEYLEAIKQLSVAIWLWTSSVEVNE